MKQGEIQNEQRRIKKMSRETLINSIENWIQQMDVRGLKFIYAFAINYSGRETKENLE